MTMKLASLPLALLAAAAGPALAQSVTLYGLVDTGIEVINEAGADGSTVVRMPTITGQSASRWGMRGSEDLGHGLKAVFVLESGLAPDTGGFQQGNRLFGRQLYVGLQGGWGTLTFGRQYSALLAGGMVDPFLASIYGPGSLDIYFAGPRMDNAIGYSGSFGPLSVGGTYSLGRDNNGSAAPACAGESPTDDKACRAWSAVVKYDTAGWGVGAWIDTQHGAGAQQNDTDTRSSLNGHVKLGAAKLILGVIPRQRDHPAQERCLVPGGQLCRHPDLQRRGGLLRPERQEQRERLQPGRAARELPDVQAHHALRDRRSPQQRRHGQWRRHA